MEINMKEFECVCKEQYNADCYHADYRVIKAENRNKAKKIYSKQTGVDYKNVLCKTKKDYPQW